MGVGPPIQFYRQIRRPPLSSLADIRPWDGLAALGRLVAQGWRADADRRSLWLPVAMAGGIALYFALPDEPAVWCAGAALGTGLVLALVTVRLRAFPHVQAMLALCAAFSIGFADAQFRTERVAAPVLTRKAGPVHIRGRVEALDPHNGRLRILIGALSPIRRLGPNSTPAKIRITTRLKDFDIEPGDWIRVTAMLMPPPEPATPGGYDFGRVAYYQRIGAVGYAYGYPHRIAAPRPASLYERIGAAIESLRDTITTRIISVIGPREGPIAAALVTGKRGAIEEDDTAAFRDAGLAHVLVIAGVHLSLASGFFFFLVRALLAAIPAIALRYPIKKWAAVAALFGAFTLLVISGCGEPAMRATIMLTVMFGAVLVDRPALSMRAVALAAAIILLLQPEGLVAAGFQMSFAAVIALIARAEWVRRRARDDDGDVAGEQTHWGKFWRYFAGISITSAVAGFATAPFSIFHFDRAAQYGILGNMLAMPIVALVIMPAETVAMLAMPFGLDRWPLLVMGKGVWATIRIAHFVAGLPGAATMVPSWPYATLTLTALGGLWLVIWQARWRWLGLAPVAVGIVLAMLAPRPDVLVSRDGRDVAVRLADGRLAFVHPPTDEFSAGAVLRRDGDNRDPSAAIGGSGIACDAQGCTARLPDGMLLAASARVGALREDCLHAAIVIAAVPTRHRCQGPKLVIDRFDVAKNGAYALRLAPTLGIETVRDWRGLRPWSEKPQRRSQYRRMRPTSLP